MAWALASSWTYTAPVPYVDFSGLGIFSDVRVLMRGVTASAVVYRALQVGINNGPPFLDTSVDYINLESAGGEASGLYIAFSDSATTGTRDGDIEINMFNLPTVPKIAQRMSYIAIRTTIMPTLSPLKSVRVLPSPAANFTGGIIYVYGR